MIRVGFKVLLIGLLVPQVCMGGQALDRLEQFYAQVKTLKAEFEQTLLDDTAQIVQQSSGTVYIQRPGKLRWEYRKPYEQLIVSDGKRFWMYDSDLEQVTIRKIDEVLGNTPALILSGKQTLEQHFKLEDLGQREKIYWVKLVPKKPGDSDFGVMRIGFGEELEWMELEDNFKQVTRIHFKSVQRNLQLDEALFVFKPEPGMEVVEQEN